jgi:hypothetical protein
MAEINLADYERAIGRLSLRWAIAEHALDRSIAILHHIWRAGDTEKTLPLNARAKIKHFRKVSLAVPEFANVSQLIEEIATEAFRLLDERNWCIHGTALAFEMEAVGYPIELKRLSRPHLNAEETRQFTIEQINQIADDCASLAVMLALFQCEPLGFISKDHIKDVFRRFGVEPPF